MKKLNLIHSATFLLSREESVKVDYDVGNIVQSMRFAIDPSITEPVGQLAFFDGRAIIYVPEVSSTTALVPVKSTDQGRTMEWRISVEFAKTAHLVNVALVEFFD
jgi:hypothetical protein